VAEPDLSGNEEKYVVDAIRSSWISSSGKYIDRFEAAFADACGTPHAVAVCNGTVALHLALVALGVQRGDEVIVPALTYVATANAVTYVGATPIFVDVDPISWCIDPESVEQAITARTRAVIAVHIYGQPADMYALQRICGQAGISLVEDAAEAPLATYDGRPTGGLGDVATFSFYGNKVLTSGEGGALTMHSDRIADLVRLYKGQGMDPKRRYWFPVIGYNYRMTNVEAALLCAQLERRDVLIEARLAVYQAYEDRLKPIPGVKLQEKVPDTSRSPWLFSVLINEREFGCSRDQLMSHLDRLDIETRPFFPLLNTLPPYARERTERTIATPVAEQLAAQGVNLPTSSRMSMADVHRVCQGIEMASQFGSS